MGSATQSIKEGKKSNHCRLIARRRRHQVAAWQQLVVQFFSTNSLDKKHYEQFYNCIYIYIYIYIYVLYHKQNFILYSLIAYRIQSYFSSCLIIESTVSTYVYVHVRMFYEWDNQYRDLVDFLYRNLLYACSCELF